MAPEMHPAHNRMSHESHPHSARGDDVRKNDLARLQHAKHLAKAFRLSGTRLMTQLLMIRSTELDSTGVLDLPF
jgi:hypothetical protein